MKAKQAIKVVEEFDDATYWARMMREHIESSRLANTTVSKAAVERHERSARKLFKALVGRYPTPEELDDILY